MRGIQYAAVSRFHHLRSGILDHPLSRMMTAGVCHGFDFDLTDAGSRSRRAVRPSFAKSPALFIRRAQGMPGARSARSLACKSRKHASKSPRSRRVARHSPRNGFNSCFALSPVTGLSCHRRLADTSATLDASVGASGPHDFAVRRVSALVRCAARVHRIPCPTSVTIAKRPSVWDGMARDMQVICVRRERKYF
jgi:hypothetical protein